MKKIIILGMALAFFCYCASKQERVEKTVEDGVEVVLNHLEPYQVKGESGVLRLEREFSIDTENEALFKLGLTGIETFDVDAEGNIYIIQWQSKENYVFKFDSAGNFIKSFMRFGQGPAFPVRAKKNHLYCIGEKESGYKELIVYKMYWQ